MHPSSTLASLPQGGLPNRVPSSCEDECGSPLGKKIRTDHTATTNGGSSRKSKKKCDNEQAEEQCKAQQQCLVDRLDINVHFGVKGGFVLYTQEEPVFWRSSKAAAQYARTHEPVWAEVVWEISVNQFRLQLLHLDIKARAWMSLQSEY